jgi:CRISPR system Cascade subunit CasD
MKTLIFQLQAPLSAWGDMAVGEQRPSADYPSQSAIHGLLGAALGIDRADDAAHRALQTSIRLAVGVVHQGNLLRDFHTAQVPSRTDLKKRPHATRRDELQVSSLNTILSTRDYRQNAAALVALQTNGETSYSLDELAAALMRPRFVLYVGRKSCPLAVPLYPRVLDADSVRAAFDIYQEQLSLLCAQYGLAQAGEAVAKVRKIVWGDDFDVDELTVIGAARDLSVNRRDQVISRIGWQFADRREHIALLAKE